MYSSKIKEIWENIHSILNINNKTINSMKNKNNILNIPNFKENKDLFIPEDYAQLSDFLVHKFQETSNIFSKFSISDFFSFIYLSNYCTYNEGDLLFSKDDECNSYIFILNGDLNLYTEKDISSKTTINSTIPAGDVYGQLIKDKYNYYIRAKNNISIISILKPNFDELIMSINKRIKTFKPTFIKKFFPNIRIFSDDVINNILTFFERIIFQKYDKILSKGDFNEYIYLIIKGDIGYCLESKSIFINNNIILDDYNYILLEKLSRGEVIGINSALDGIKNDFNCIVLSDEAEFYRISKGDYLFYFGGQISDSALNLKAIGDLQQMAVNKKIDYLKKINIEDIKLMDSIVKNFFIKIPKNDKINFGSMIIYEDPIENVLFEKWKTIKIGLSDFKNKLIGQKKKRMDEIKKSKSDIDNNINFNRKDIGIIKKDQTLSLYRVTKGRLNLKLNSNQMKSLKNVNGLYHININSKDENNGKIKHKKNNNIEKNDDNDLANSSIIKLDEEEEKGEK